jgi:hypothetical protein
MPLKERVCGQIGGLAARLTSFPTLHSIFRISSTFYVGFGLAGCAFARKETEFPVQRIFVDKRPISGVWTIQCLTFWTPLKQIVGRHRKPRQSGTDSLKRHDQINPEAVTRTQSGDSLATPH